MYRLIQDGKTANRRLILRKAWLIAVCLIIPLMLISAAANSRVKIYSYFLAILGLLILVIQFRRPRNSLKTTHVTPLDWLIIVIANIFISACILITGGVNSYLLILFLIPLIFFTAEFGFHIGLLHCIPAGIFIFYHGIFYRNIPVSFWFQLWVLAVTGGVFLWTAWTESILETRYHQKIDRIIHLDELTGLYNRRFLKSIIRQTIKNDTPFILTMIDINYFKYFNDCWGHSRGDSLLIQISRLIRETVTQYDKVIRYSGDEFIIFSPFEMGSSNPEDRMNLTVNAIQQKVEETYFPGAECFPSQKLTLSFGTVIYPDEAPCYETLIEAADQALYRNKQNR
jgi:diguanylate cyclase (GGDEF)-like protein